MFDLSKLFNRDDSAITPDQLRSVLQSIESKYTTLQEENRELMQAIEEQKGKLESHEAQAGAFSALKLEAQTLEEKHAALTLENEKLQTRLEEAKQPKENGLEALKVHSDRIAQLEAENLDLTGRIEAALERVKGVSQLEEEGLVLQKQLEEMRAIAQTVPALEEENLALKGQLDGMQAQQENLAQLETENLELLEQIERLEAEKQELSAQASSALAIDDERQVLMQQIGPLTAQLTRLEEENLRLEQSLQDHIELQSQQMQEYQIIEQERSRLADRINQLEAENYKLSQALKDSDAIPALMETDPSQLTALEEENQRLKEQRDLAEARAESQQQHIQELEAEVARLLAPKPAQPSKPHPQPQWEAQATVSQANREDRRKLLSKMLRG